MTNLDIGRRFDIEELMKLRNSAQNMYWRDKYDEQIAKIIRQSGVIGGEREKLIEAVRAGDRRAVRYFQERIKNIEKDETYGRASA